MAAESAPRRREACLRYRAIGWLRCICAALNLTLLAVLLDSATAAGTGTRLAAIATWARASPAVEWPPRREPAVGLAGPGAPGQHRRLGNKGHHEESDASEAEDAAAPEKAASTVDKMLLKVQLWHIMVLVALVFIGMCLASRYIYQHIYAGTVDRPPKYKVILMAATSVTDIVGDVWVSAQAVQLWPALGILSLTHLATTVLLNFYLVLMFMREVRKTSIFYWSMVADRGRNGCFLGVLSIGCFGPKFLELLTSNLFCMEVFSLDMNPSAAKASYLSSLAKLSWGVFYEGIVQVGFALFQIVRLGPDMCPSALCNAWLSLANSTVQVLMAALEAMLVEEAAPGFALVDPDDPTAAQQHACKAGCGKASWNGKQGGYCSRSCQSKDAKPVCTRPGCGKPTWNGQLGEYCSTKCKNQGPLQLPIAPAAATAVAPGTPLCANGCGKPTFNGKTGECCSNACKDKWQKLTSPKAATPVCLAPGCGKPTWNSHPNEYCSKGCRAKNAPAPAPT